MQWRRFASVLMISSTLAVACSEDDPATDASATSDPGVAAPTHSAATVDGCANGVTDPADMRIDRTIARCDVGAPAPRPLAKTERVVVTTAFRLEFVAPLLVADAFGE